jgi:hypothetical protein
LEQDRTHHATNLDLNPIGAGDGQAKDEQRVQVGSVARFHGGRGESIHHGTSQATPVTVGIILPLQEFYQRHAGELPTVDQVTTWLRRGVPIRDGDDEDDNVKHTNPTFLRLDAVRALTAAHRELVRMRLGPLP